MNCPARREGVSLSWGHEIVASLEEVQDMPAPVSDLTITRKDMALLLEALTPRERTVIEMRFGIDGGGTTTMVEVGAAFGVSKARIMSIEDTAIRKMTARAIKLRMRPRRSNWEQKLDRARVELEARWAAKHAADIKARMRGWTVPAPRTYSDDEIAAAHLAWFERTAADDFP